MILQDHGSPESFQTNTELTIRVKDADDQNPVFTKPVYHANITESAQFTVSIMDRGHANLANVRVQWQSDTLPSSSETQN